MNKQAEMIRVCSKCGSENVYSNVFVNINKLETSLTFNFPENTQFWCENCEEYSFIEKI
jgi:hypothetical protein